MRWRRPPVRVTGAIAFLVIALAWIGGGLPKLAVGTGVDSFLPADDATVSSLGEVADTFGGEPIVVLLRQPEEGDLLDENHLPGLLRLEGLLAGVPDVAVTYGPATTLNQTAARAQRLLLELSGRRDGLRAAADKLALERFEERYGALLLRGMPAGLPTLKNPKFVRHVVYGENGQAQPRWRKFVPSDNDVAIYVRPRADIDQDAAARLTEQVTRTVESANPGASRTTVTGTPVVTAELAERGRKELPLLGGVALLAVAGALLVVPWARRRRRILPLIPMALATCSTLAWFGWRGDPVSLGAVAFLPVILGVGSYYPVYLAQRRHRRLVLGVAAAAAAAFATLGMSPLPFVRDLGFAIALGIVLVVVSSLALAPFLGGRPDPGGEAGAPAGTPAAPSAPSAISVGLVAVLAAAAAAGWAVLPQVEIETEPQQLLAGLPAFERADEAEQVLGYSAEVDVVLTGGDVLSPPALSWLRRAEARIVTAHGDKVQPMVSPAELLGFLGQSPTQQQIDAAMRLLPPYLTTAAVAADRQQAVISLGGTWDGLSGDPTLIPALERALPEPPPGYEVSMTGLPVATARGYDLVSESRYPANLIGILAATVALALALSRRRDTLLATAAAVLATGAAIFTAWAFGVAFNPLTLALGPLTAAVGCEFAVLLTQARRDKDAPLRRSVFLAAGLSACGYAALSLSEIPVVRDFGIALVAALGLALVSALAVVEASGWPIAHKTPRTTKSSRHDLATEGV